MLFSREDEVSLRFFGQTDIKWYSKCTTQLASSLVLKCLFPKFSLGKMILCFLLVGQIWVAWQIATYYGTVWSWYICILTRKRKKTDNNYTKSYKRGSKNGLNSQPFGLFTLWCTVKKNRFQYSLVLYISVFPDYLSVYCDYTWIKHYLPSKCFFRLHW